MSIKCGKSDQATEYVKDILKIAECDAGCSCDDGQPQLVTGLGINGNDVVVQEGVGVQIDELTSNGTTYYTVNLSAENVQKLANISAAIVAAGANVVVTPSDPSVVGGIPTITYTVAATDTVVETQLVRVLMTMQGANPPIFSIVSNKQYGSSFTTPSQGGGS